MLTYLFDRWPLRRQIVVVAGGAVLLFGLGAAEFVRQNELRAFERTFREQTSKLVGTLAAASLDAVLSTDRPVLDTIIQSLVEEDPEIEAVAVFDDRGDTITDWQRPGAEGRASAAGGEGTIEFTRDVVLEGEVYGRMDVVWNVSRRHAEIRDYATRIHLYAAGISIALALLMLAIVNALLGRPVRVIHERLRALDGGAELAPLRLAGARELRDIAGTVDSLGDVLALQRRKEAELEAVSHQKSDFLANMSHELRTPMNGVLGMLALVADTPLSPVQAEQVRIASNSGRNLLRLINDILDFSKVEAGRLEFERIAFDLEALVDETAEALAGQAHAKGLSLACTVHPDVPVEVLGDPTRLRQVLTNLAGNAVKFTTRGHVELVVARVAGCGPVRPDTLRFEVIDTGVGIAADALDDIFESFAQADGSTTRNYGGTGLGLAISRQLIEGMDGAIGVISTHGAGSRFWFELELPVTQAGGLRVAERARAALDTDVRRSAILASANPLVASRTGALLAELGVDVRRVADGPALLAALRERSGSHGIDNPDVPAGPAGSDGSDRVDARAVIFDACLDDVAGSRLVRLVEADPAFDDVELVPLGAALDGAEDGAGGDAGDASRTGSADDSRRRIRAPLALPVSRAALTRLYGATTRNGPSELERAALAAERRARFASVSVLVVEDNPVNQEVALGMLAKLGVRAETADNGSEGLAALGAGHFDAVLMDCQMPVMDGYAATRELRARELAAGGDRHVPVIALTANAMQGDAERCLVAGMDDYLAKPFDPVRLEDILERWTTGAAEAACAADEPVPPTPDVEEGRAA